MNSSPLLSSEPLPFDLESVWQTAPLERSPEYYDVFYRIAVVLDARAVGRLISLVENLSSPYRDWALYYLSIHLFHLPETVRVYIESLEGSEGEDGHVVREGRSRRQSKERWPLWRFPVWWLAEALKEVSSTGASTAESQV